MCVWVCVLGTLRKHDKSMFPWLMIGVQLNLSAGGQGVLISSFDTQNKQRKDIRWRGRPSSQQVCLIGSGVGLAIDQIKGLDWVLIFWPLSSPNHLRGHFGVPLTNCGIGNAEKSMTRALTHSPLKIPWWSIAECRYVKPQFIIVCVAKYMTNTEMTWQGNRKNTGKLESRKFC